MAEPKTRPTDQSPQAFLEGVADEDQRRDAFTVLAMMSKVTRQAPVMWGTDIIGFGVTPLKYASGRELDWPVIGFSPRKRDLTLYLGQAIHQSDGLMARLGKFKTGKSCLYIHRLRDVDLTALEELIRKAAGDR